MKTYSIGGFHSIGRKELAYSCRLGFRKLLSFTLIYSPRSNRFRSQIFKRRWLFCLICFITCCLSGNRGRWSSFSATQRISLTGIAQSQVVFTYAHYWSVVRFQEHNKIFLILRSFLFLRNPVAFPSSFALCCRLNDNI